MLDVTADSVVSEDAAREMAEGARRVLRADVGIAVTGVAGPAEQDGVAVGTVCFGIALPGPARRSGVDAPAGRPRAHPPVRDDLAAEPVAAAPRRARPRARVSAPVLEIQINIDCADLDRMVAFYTAALGYVAHGAAG